MDTFISYDGLPLASGGAHSISSLPPKEVYSSLLKFLNACTNHPVPKIELLFNPSPAMSSMKLVWQLTKLFGLPKWNMNGIQHEWIWRVKNNKTEAAFDALQSSNALTLTFHWKFKFVHPETKVILTGQNLIPVVDERVHNSQIYFMASQKSTVSAWFTLPFSSFAEATEYFAPFSELLPFRPSSKHWRVWKLSKNGNWTPRRVEKNVS